MSECTCLYAKEHLVQTDVFCPQHRKVPLVHEDEIRLLQGRLAELKSAVIMAMDRLGSNHPVFWILDDYDGSGDSIKVLVRDVIMRRWELDLLARQRDQLLGHCQRAEAVGQQVIPLQDVYEIMITDPETGSRQAHDARIEALRDLAQDLVEGFHDVSGHSYPGEVHRCRADACTQALEVIGADPEEPAPNGSQ